MFRRMQAHFTPQKKEAVEQPHQIQKHVPRDNEAYIELGKRFLDYPSGTAMGDQIRAHYSTHVLDQAVKRFKVHASAEKRMEMPLCVDSLTELGPDAQIALSNARTVEDMKSPDLITKLWVTLNNNIVDARNWRKFPSPICNDSISDEQTPMEMGRARLHLSRFKDDYFGNMPLRAATAIPDAVRSKRYGVTQFLHANEVDLQCGRAFIASQCPVEGEFSGLWHMLHAKEVPLIVDLASSKDYDDSDKMAGEKHYSPLEVGQELVLNDNRLKVVCVEKRVLWHDVKDSNRDVGRAAKALNWMPSKKNQDAEPEFVPTLTVYRLKISDGEKSKEIQRLHFSNWPDHRSIEPDALIKLANQVEAISPDPTRPIMVHCYAGVGRTGTLMSFIAARQRIAEKLIAEPVTCTPELIMTTLLEVIAKGRIDRGYLFVQSKKQFECLAEALGIVFADAITKIAMPRPTPNEVNVRKSMEKSSLLPSLKLVEDKEDKPLPTTSIDDPDRIEVAPSTPAIPKAITTKKVENIFEPSYQQRSQSFDVRRLNVKLPKDARLSQDSFGKRNFILDLDEMAASRHIHFASKADLAFIRPKGQTNDGRIGTRVQVSTREPLTAQPLDEIRQQANKKTKSRFNFKRWFGGLFNQKNNSKLPLKGIIKKHSFHALPEIPLVTGNSLHSYLNQQPVLDKQALPSRPSIEKFVRPKKSISVESRHEDEMLSDVDANKELKDIFVDFTSPSFDKVLNRDANWSNVLDPSGFTGTGPIDEMFPDNAQQAQKKTSLQSTLH